MLLGRAAKKPSTWSSISIAKLAPIVMRRRCVQARRRQGASLRCQHIQGDRAACSLGLRSQFGKPQSWWACSKLRRANRKAHDSTLAPNGPCSPDFREVGVGRAATGCLQLGARATSARQRAERLGPTIPPANPKPGGRPASISRKGCRQGHRSAQHHARESQQPSISSR